MSGRFSSASPPSVSSSNNTNVNIPGAGLGNNNNIPGGLGININNNGLPLLRATLVQVKKNLKRFLLNISLIFRVLKPMCL